MPSEEMNKQKFRPMMSGGSHTEQAVGLVTGAGRLGAGGGEDLGR